MTFDLLEWRRQEDARVTRNRDNLLKGTTAAIYTDATGHALKLRVSARSEKRVKLACGQTSVVMDVDQPGLILLEP